MAISDYNSLVTAVSGWLHRTDLTANIPDFIQLAEVRLARELRVWPLVTSTTMVVTGSLTTTVTLPTNYMETVNMLRGDGQEMQYVPFSTFIRLANQPTSIPWVYSVKSNVVLIAPPSSATTTMVMSYYKKEEPLTSINLTNWYVINAPDLLLYGSLLESSTFLSNDERLTTWANLYTTAADNVNKQYGLQTNVKNPLAAMIKANK